MTQEVHEISRNIDQIIGIIEKSIRGTISPSEFDKQIDFEILVDSGNFHISRSTAKLAGAEWKTHVHLDNDETIIMTRGKGVVVIANQQFILGNGESIRVPKGVEHGGYALTDDAEIVSVVVPADENTKKLKGFLESAKSGN